MFKTSNSIYQTAMLFFKFPPTQKSWKNLCRPVFSEFQDNFNFNNRFDLWRPVLMKINMWWSRLISIPNSLGAASRSKNNALPSLSIQEDIFTPTSNPTTWGFLDRFNNPKKSGFQAWNGSKRFGGLGTWLMIPPVKWFFNDITYGNSPWVGYFPCIKINITSP